MGGLRRDPAAQYRGALRAIDAYAARHYGGRPFAELTGADQDAVVGAIEEGSLPIEDVVTKDFWTMLLKNTREGFFADPVYGGIRTVQRRLKGWRSDAAHKLVFGDGELATAIVPIEEQVTSPARTVS